jgi:hypothetical protein
MSGTSTIAWRPATTESPAKTLATARIPTTQIQRMRELKTTFELALQRQCTENSKQIFPEMKLPGLCERLIYSQDLYGTLRHSATRPSKTYSMAVRAIPLSVCHQGLPSG